MICIAPLRIQVDDTRLVHARVGNLFPPPRKINDLSEASVMFWSFLPSQDEEPIRPFVKRNVKSFCKWRVWMLRIGEIDDL